MQKAVDFFEAYPADQFVLVKLCNCPLNANWRIPGAIVEALTLGYILNQHWYAILHNLDKGFDFILEFTVSGVTTRKLRKENHTLDIQSAEGWVKNGYALKTWILSFPKYNYFWNNCQDFVKKLASLSRSLQVA